MRKGLTVTLLTVAIAMMGFNAMAMAPTVSDIRDLIVVDDTPVSGQNWFVYPDAIDLHKSVSDDNVTSAAQITWSFFSTSSKYTLNGVGPLGVSDDPVSPPAGNVIYGSGSTADDPGAADNDMFTVTVRNENLSPVASYATSGGTDPAGTGIIASETVVVTLFASDGDLAGSDTLTIYTEDDGLNDRMSPEGGETVVDWTFTGSQTNGWVFSAGFGGATSAGTGAAGMCITTALTGENYGAWDAPYGDVDLVDNAVYEIRLGMATTQQSVDQIPVWSFVASNLELGAGGAPAGQIPANVYHGDWYFLEQFGGSQGIGTAAGRSDFVLYYAPASFQLASWRSSTTGAFTPSIDGINDMAFTFRIIDNDTSLAASANDEGTICVETLQINRIDFDTMTAGAAVFSDSDLQSGDFSSAGWGAQAGTLSFSGGNMTLAPPAGGWNNNIDTVAPGNLTVFPLAWDADKILMQEWEMSAPTQTDTDNAPDAFSLIFDAASAETFQISYILPNQPFDTVQAAMLPVAPSTASYASFCATNAASAAPAGFNLLRPRLDVLNLNTVGVGNNTGSFTINSVTVTEYSL